MVSARNSHRSLWVTAVALLVFVALLVTVLFDTGPVLFDGLVLRALEVWRTPARTDFIRALTGMGNKEFMIPGSTLVVLVVAWRSRRAAVFLAAAYIGSALLNEGMKMLIDRPRPSIVLRVYEPRGLSFPSGHSQGTMAFALGLVLVFWSLRLEWRRQVLAIFALPLVVGWTRTYLGVHYPTDVLAGWCLGTVWVMLCFTWFRHDHLPPFAKAPEEIPEIREEVREPEGTPILGERDDAAEVRESDGSTAAGPSADSAAGELAPPPR